MEDDWEARPGELVPPEQAINDDRVPVSFQFTPVKFFVREFQYCRVAPPVFDKLHYTERFLSTIAKLYDE